MEFIFLFSLFVLSAQKNCREQKKQEYSKNVITCDTLQLHGKKNIWLKLPSSIQSKKSLSEEQMQNIHPIECALEYFFTTV